jgi:ribosome-binding factor A
VEQARAAIAGAAGFLKKKIGDELDLRFVPELRFKYDDSAVVGARIDEILDKVCK